MILGKFWSRYDLQNFRKLIFLVYDQGELSKGTVDGHAMFDWPVQMATKMADDRGMSVTPYSSTAHIN